MAQSTLDRTGDSSTPVDAAIEEVAGELESDDQPEVEVEAAENLSVDDADLSDDDR